MLAAAASCRSRFALSFAYAHSVYSDFQFCVRNLPAAASCRTQFALTFAYAHSDFLNTTSLSATYRRRAGRNIISSAAAAGGCLPAGLSGTKETTSSPVHAPAIVTVPSSDNDTLITRTSNSVSAYHGGGKLPHPIRAGVRIRSL